MGGLKLMPAYYLCGQFHIGTFILQLWRKILGKRFERKNWEKMLWKNNWGEKNFGEHFLEMKFWDPFSQPQHWNSLLLNCIRFLSCKRRVHNLSEALPNKILISVEVSQNPQQKMLSRKNFIASEMKFIFAHLSFMSILK